MVIALLGAVWGGLVEIVVLWPLLVWLDLLAPLRVLLALVWGWRLRCWGFVWGWLVVIALPWSRLEWTGSGDCAAVVLFGVI